MHGQEKCLHEDNSVELGATKPKNAPLRLKVALYAKQAPHARHAMELPCLQDEETQAPKGTRSQRK